MDITEYIITEEYTVLQAMEAINRNAHGIAYVCNGAVLCAAVTDGNIRRYILENKDLRASVSKAANYDPKYIMGQDDINPTAFMKANGIRSVPILNSRHEIIAIKFLHASSIYVSKDLRVPVVIMAGGKGTRLAPMTQVLPKPLIPVNHKTITEIIMDKFMEFGCNEFNMIVNYKKQLIKAFFLEAENPYNVRFTEETEYLGTGGGLALLKGQYSSSFFITNCDILIDEDYGEIIRQHEAEKRILTLVCAMKNVTLPYGVVELGCGGQVTKLEEKPSTAYKVNTGFYVASPRFLDYIPDHTFIHITEIIGKCITAGERVGIYPISESRWWDMGQVPELNRMRNDFAQGGSYE